MKKPDRLYILGIPLDHLTLDEAGEIISERIQAKTKTLVFTPNVDHAVKAQFDQEFREIYSKADLSLADGMPLVWVSRLYGGRLPERINGTNLVWRLAQIAQAKGFSIFLLGAREEITSQAADKIRAEYPGVKIAGHYSPPYNTIFNRDEAAKIISKVNSSRPDILLVAFGPVKQEKWIFSYSSLLDARVFVGIGGALDLISGRIRRAPRWMQDFGLEWLFRLCQEPLRLWKRYLIGNSIFIYLVLKQAVKVFLSRLKEPYS